jgi:hypothetical protein
MFILPRQARDKQKGKLTTKERLYVQDSLRAKYDASSNATGGAD